MVAVMLMSVLAVAGLCVLAYTLAVYALPFMLVSPRRLALVKVDGERIPRRSDGELPENAANLSPVVASMQGNMGQHFLAGHITLVAIGEGEGDRLGQGSGRNRAKVVEIPLVRGRNGSFKLVQRRRFFEIVGREAVRNALQMAGKYPRDNIIMTDQP